MKNRAYDGFLGKKIVAKKAKTAILALQGAKGTAIATLKRSLKDSRVRVATMPGTLQPTPTNIGIKALPGKFIAFIMRSTKNADLAKKPLDSKTLIPT